MPPREDILLIIDCGSMSTAALKREAEKRRRRLISYAGAEA